VIHKTIVVGPLQCNCILLGCETTREAVLIDPGDEPEKILTALDEAKLDVKFILHTHAHFDHVGGTAGVRAKINAPTCLHQADEMLYQNLPMQGKMFGIPLAAAPKLEKYLEHEEVLRFGNYALSIIHTPGHSPGSLCFKLKDAPALYSGDTLFQQSVGRADLWGGDERQLIRSIKERLLTLDDETLVHPGHGPSTSIGVEKRSNPFLI
jgi:hydroxyacylglutathione hydrolase